MKHLLLLILLMLPLSCYDGLSDMYDNLGMKVPICVDGDTGSDLNDGRGWGNAVATLVQALALADEGGEIWIKQGDYNLSSNITIVKSIKVYGGFNGTESRLQQRDFNTNISSFSNGGDWFEINTEIVVFLDGLTFTGFGDKVISIQNGASLNIMNCRFISNTGGGVISAYSSSSCMIDNCEFTGNTMLGANGGAIVANNSNVEIRNTIFNNNGAVSGGYYGGAIFCTSGDLKITDSRFDANHADSGNGGAIYFAAGCEGQITRTYFLGNTTRYGGAINSEATNIRITDCIFNENIASSSSLGNGGAIRSRSGSSIEISGSTFTNNESASYGGGIDSTNSGLIIKNSFFNGNISLSPGGALNITGNNDPGSSIIIVNTLFSNNQCTSAGFWGGGVNFTASSGTMEMYMSNCTFYSNTGTGANSGSFYMSNTTSHINNTLFYGNSGSYSIEGGTAQIKNCAWDKGENSAGTVENIQTLTSSPFVSIVDGNASFLRLAAGSVCINRGTDTIDIPGFTMPSTDLAGNPRKVGTIDIGCYEKQ